MWFTAGIVIIFNSSALYFNCACVMCGLFNIDYAYFLVSVKPLDGKFCLFYISERLKHPISRK